MTRYAAFLRAINTAGRYIKMADLRRAFEAIPGLTRVQTFINSGNVLFDAKAASASDLEVIIETHLERALGFSAPTFLRTAPEMAALARFQPFPWEQPGESDSLYVMFLRAAPAPEQLDKLLALSNPVDRLAVFENHLFWTNRRQLGKSILSMTQVERAAAGPVTTRSITTVVKIEKLLQIG